MPDKSKKMLTAQKLVFKKLDPNVCGPHCFAKDNGSGKYVHVSHCPKCHEESNFAISERPMH